MMPIASNTQNLVPTQVPLVTTPLPGTAVLRALPDAVAPSIPDASVSPDSKGNGVYASLPSAPAATSPLAPLSTPIPATLSTSNATLSASAMFATQLLSQDAQAGNGFLAEYEALVMASQVKYKPSNATLPEPAPNNLFAKMLSETQTQSNTRVSVQLQQAPREAPIQAPAQASSLPKQPQEPVKQKNNAGAQAASYSPMNSAVHAYHATSVRNKEVLENENGEAIIG